MVVSSSPYFQEADGQILGVFTGFASDIIEIDGKIAGYLEYKTPSHKTARLAQRQGLSMPLVAPAWGVGNTPWAIEFAKVATLANRPLDSLYTMSHNLLRQRRMEIGPIGPPALWRRNGGCCASWRRPSEKIQM